MHVVEIHICLHTELELHGVCVFMCEDLPQGLSLLSLLKSIRQTKHSGKTDFRL